jgi:hypothetical protein
MAREVHKLDLQGRGFVSVEQAAEEVAPHDLQRTKGRRGRTGFHCCDPAVAGRALGEDAAG